MRSRLSGAADGLLGTAHAGASTAFGGRLGRARVVCLPVHVRSSAGGDVLPLLTRLVRRVRARSALGEEVRSSGGSAVPLQPVVTEEEILF